MAPSKKAIKSSVKSSVRKKVVLAYSGGLDTSVAIRWLQEKYDVDVIAVGVDVGQPGQMDEAIERAYTIGAVKAYAVDAKKEFAESYVFKALKAWLTWQRRRRPITSLMDAPPRAMTRYVSMFPSEPLPRT